MTEVAAPETRTLSVVVPVYNEREWIERLVAAVEAADTLGVRTQVVIVDDCSNDGTREMLRQYEARHTVVYKQTNGGKGSAVFKGT